MFSMSMIEVVIDTVAHSEYGFTNQMRHLTK
jgi:hypothetical protein